MRTPDNSVVQGELLSPQTPGAPAAAPQRREETDQAAIMMVAEDSRRAQMMWKVHWAWLDLLQTLLQPWSSEEMILWGLLMTKSFLMYERVVLTDSPSLQFADVSKRSENLFFLYLEINGLGEKKLHQRRPLLKVLHWS